MILVDVHAHMDMEGYEIYGGADRVIEECIKNDVAAIVSNGVSPESNRKVLRLAEKYAVIKPALGIYPTHCVEIIEKGGQKEFDDEIIFIEEKIKEKKCLAIGEVGLEYKEINDVDKLKRDEKKRIQKECLKRFCELATEHNIPIILHSRGAELEIVEFLENNGMKNRKVIMHCFSGRKHLIKRIMDNGWYFSIPANITRSEHFQGIVKDVPLSKILTETDSPLLGPIRDKANRPDNVLLAIQKIAGIKKMDAIEVANIIYNNYQKVFL